MLEIQQELIINFCSLLHRASATKDPLPVMDHQSILQIDLIKSPKPTLKHLCAKRVQARGETLLAKFPRATRCLSKHIYTCRSIGRYDECRPLVLKPFAQHHWLPHWKYVLRCCEKCPGISIPRQDKNKDATNTCSKIHFHVRKMYHIVLFMAYTHMNNEQFVICVPLILVL